MGFSRDKIRAEADKTFKGLEIDDTEEGTVTLRNVLRLNDEERSSQTELGKKFEALQSDENATLTELNTVLIDLAEVLADKKGVMPTYLSDFDTTELLALYSLWAEETQLTDSKSA